MSRLFALLLATLTPAIAGGQVAAPAPTRVAPTPVAPIGPVVAQLPHISVVSTGRGPAVILIPGLSSPRATWDGVVPALARTHRVYLVQINGFGGDTARGNAAPGILAGVVADLDAYLARERIAGVAVVGHSLGGLVALMLARDHPGDVGRVMVVDSLPWIGALLMPGGSVAAIEPRAARMRDAIAATPVDDSAVQRTAFGLAATPAARARIVPWVKAADRHVTAQALYEDMTNDLRPALPSIAAPITLVYPYGATVPRARADALYRGEYAGARRVTFVPVGDSAHFVMLDQPSAFATALDAFLAGRVESKDGG